MKRVSISGLKNQLSAYLQRVLAGQTVIVYDRGRPITRIDRVADDDPASVSFVTLDQRLLDAAQR